jgi:hypothetical protein
MNQREQPTSIEHERVYHAASRGLAASLSLTATCLRGLKKACPVESEKTAGVFAAQRPRLAPLKDMGGLGSIPGMLVSCRLEESRLVPLALEPYGEDDPQPDIGERSHGDGMAFARSSLALGVIPGPGFLPGARLRKLMQRVAQGLATAIAPVGLEIHPALEEHRRGSSQGLQTRRISIAAAIIADFGEQPRCESLPCSRQRGEDLAVRMGQKKGVDLLVIGGNLLHQGQELRNQSQQQARFGTRGDGLGGQVWLMQGLENLGRHLLCRGMPGIFEHLGDLLYRSSQSCLRRGVGLQEDQRRVLVQRAREQGKRDPIVGYASGRELVDQAGLHLEQRILVACQRFEFGDQLALRSQAAQISKVSASRLGEQRGIAGIGFGSRCGPAPIHGAWVDRIDGPARLKPERYQQASVGLNYACHLLLVRPCELLETGVQFGKSRCGCDPHGSNPVGGLSRQAPRRRDVGQPSRYQHKTSASSFSLSQNGS